MAKRALNPFVKLALEIGPLIAFFIAYFLFKDSSFTIFGTVYSGFITITAVFVVVMILSTAVVWALTGTLSKMQIVSLLLVIVMGGLTVYLKDEQFIKMKPTLLYLFFAAVLGVGLLQGRSYLRDVMEAALPMTQEGWMILTRRFALFFLALALANEAVWRLLSTEVWLGFKTFALPLALGGFVFTQVGLIEKHSTEDDKTPDA